MKQDERWTGSMDRAFPCTGKGCGFESRQMNNGAACTKAARFLCKETGRVRFPSAPLTYAGENPVVYLV